MHPDVLDGGYDGPYNGPIIELRRMTVAELAEDAFLKAEHVKALSMMNTPTDFDERKKAFIALAVAREAANKAAAALDSALHS